MWFRLGVKSFIGKKVLNADGCDIFVCNFTNIWHKSMSDYELFSISKTLNPLFEASASKIRELTLNLFGKDEKVQKEIEEENNYITLKLEANRMGIKFRFQVVLNRGDGDMFYKEFTLPLLALLIRMQNRENALIQIIKYKDAEINEYKQDHPMIKNSYMSTKPFCEKEFENHESTTSLPDVAYDPSIFLDFINKTLFIQETIIKEEKNLVKSEEKKVGQSSVSDKTQFVLKNENISIGKGSEPCVKLEHQTIKRRKKNNSSFKIKI